MNILLNNRYRVLQTLGSGGFGQTYLAEDTHLPSNRKCVIKQLTFTSNDPGIHRLIQERFQQEAAVLETLGNANDQIPKLYAYFIESDQFYMVQECIAGETLARRIQTNGTLGEAKVKDIVISLLTVLNYVHSQRIIHRDIKPENIILRQKDEKPVLIDFGAIKETAKTAVNTYSQIATSITIGTPGFMPLEQVAGKPVFASDIYSLGLTAICMLTGRGPQALVDPQDGEISWRNHVSGLSTDFADVLDKAISLNFRDRYATAQEMLSAIDKTDEQITTPPKIKVQVHKIKVRVHKDLFPLFGVTLGQTTVEELAKLGKRTETINDDTKQPYKFYEINDLDFWYDDGVAESMYIARGIDQFPSQWVALGFNWNLSYNEWIACLQKLSFSIKTTKKPEVVLYRGHKSFSAEVIAKRRTEMPLEIKLGFNYSEGTAVDSKGTLYNMRIRYEPSIK